MEYEEESSDPVMMEPFVVTATRVTDYRPLLFVALAAGLYLALRRR